MFSQPMDYGNMVGLENIPKMFNPSSWSASSEGMNPGEQEDEDFYVKLGLGVLQDAYSRSKARMPQQQPQMQQRPMQPPMGMQAPRMPMQPRGFLQGQQRPQMPMQPPYYQQPQQMAPTSFQRPPQPYGMYDPQQGNPWNQQRGF